MFYRVQPYGGRGLFQHDGADKSQEESGENVGGGRGHVRSVLLSGSPDELAEVSPIEGCPECSAFVWHTWEGRGVGKKRKKENITFLPAIVELKVATFFFFFFIFSHNNKDY